MYMTAKDTVAKLTRQRADLRWPETSSHTTGNRQVLAAAHSTTFVAYTRVASSVQTNTKKGKKEKGQGNTRDTKRYTKTQHGRS